MNNHRITKEATPKEKRLQQTLITYKAGTWELLI